MNPVKVRAAESVARRGALNRALAAQLARDADLGLGLEGGVEEVRGRLYLVNSVVAVDRHGQRGEGSGVRMELPMALSVPDRDRHQDQARLHIEVGILGGKSRDGEQSK